MIGISPKINIEKIVSLSPKMIKVVPRQQSTIAYRIPKDYSLSKTERNGYEEQPVPLAGSASTSTRVHQHKNPVLL